MHRRFALLFFLVIPLVIGAEDNDTEWYQNKPIADIVFIGLQNVDQGDLTGITSEYIGEPFTDRRFLQLQQRLYALDYFTQIVANAERADAEGSEVIIEFTVQERPIVTEVVFEGNRRLRTGRLNDAVVVRQGDIVSRSRVRADEAELRRLYRENGYTQVDISSRIEETDVPGEQRVVFAITEGRQTTIRQIQFVGNSFASDGALRGAMESKQQSLFNSGVFQESVLEQDRRRIIEYYTQRGFIDAEIEEIRTEVDEEGSDRTHLIITIYVSEGEQYTFGGMQFRGNQVFSDDELAALVRHREGATVNLSRVQQDFQRVSDLYYSNGYIFNEIELEQQRDSDALTVAYTVNIQEFSRAHIENIIIRGNTKTKDHVIERELPFEVGDIFSAGKIREGLMNLMNTGFFTSVVPDTPQGSTTGLMDLIIDVEEGQTADIRLGVDIGGSADFPVSARVAWQDSNFRGMGQTVGAEIVASPIEQSLSLNFREPWLMGQRWSAGANLTMRRSVQRGVLQSFPGQDTPYGSDDSYVFTEDRTFDGTDYKAGDIFPGTPSDEEVKDLNLKTGYSHFGPSSIGDEYLMEYQNWDFILGANTGYRFLTPYGRLNLSTNASTGLNVITYDDDLYFEPWRAEDQVPLRIRDPRIINRWRFGVNLDSRDFLISPSSGYYVGQSVGLTGGFLLGSRHFIQTETTLEGYYTLFDLPVTDGWNWKLVAKGRSKLSTILPQFWVPGQSGTVLEVDRRSDLLRVNGVTIGRGWRSTDTDSNITELRGMWENTFELRMPINEQILWFDAFFDATFPYDELGDIRDTQFQDGLYGIGAGIRFSIPQLPISLYLARLFEIDDDGSIAWQTGELFNRDNEEGKGLRFVLSFSTSFF
ncbi:outer membrane protein assembly factor BamA [Spirochaeta africana]|uniref:Outer membrane protein assembly factor BamA n=1 Tax=Spirochaeta africana (strain ATCC 700263 / DSM 8902 / Z-7692) TaxID=889378 RepID=H9UJB2_SPIAZ|nr:outer membrane protein assembly factor BamA [Spirochaeta africana]AFG37605.1 Beta-barrel assembly machine subunit BamA [Spirochaeta africana DSM 8902]